MLVSMMARMNALYRRQQAESSMFHAYDTMNAMMRGVNSGAFSGASMDMLHAMDQKLELDMVRSQMDYQIASLQEKHYAQKLAQEFKSNNDRLNVIA